MKDSVKILNKWIMIMTFDEWYKSSDNQPPYEADNIPLLAELYAQYYHAKTSNPTKDVEEAIEAKYPTGGDPDDLEAAVSIDCNKAARFGYSLATKVDWDKFEQWIADKCFAYHDGDWYWESDTEGDMPLRLQYLYRLFMQEQTPKEATAKNCK